MELINASRADQEVDAVVNAASDGDTYYNSLGQMQRYVNYYDRYEIIEDENPTIGILMCKKSDEALVELTLPKDSNIYAKEYKLYLPDKKLLQEKLQEWIEASNE